MYFVCLYLQFYICKILLPEIPTAYSLFTANCQKVGGISSQQGNLPPLLRAAKGDRSNKLNGLLSHAVNFVGCGSGISKHPSEFLISPANL